MANAHDLLMAQRAAMMGGKSRPYLMRVDWLRNNSSQYIDLGFKPTDMTTIRAVVSYPNSSSRIYRRIVGDSTDYSAACSIIIPQAWRRGSDSITLSLMSEADRIELINSKDGFFVDGEKVYQPTYKPFACQKNAYLFSNNYSSLVSPRDSFKLHELEVSGDFNMFLIPVLDLSGRPCMYDQAQSEVPVDDASRFFYQLSGIDFEYGET